MNQFLKVSVMVLLSHCFFQEASIAMDPDEVSLAASRKIFQTKLGTLKKSIINFPSIFIAYGWGDKDNQDHQNHAHLVKELVEDLKVSGFEPAYDLDVRCGGKDNIHTHADKILTVDKVILIGSSHLKTKYDEGQGTITQEIFLLRTRLTKRSEQDLESGIIPLWFSGDIKDNFPGALLHLPARTLAKKSLTDMGYFENFFEVLMDIFHGDEGAIIEQIKDKKEAFLRQSNISDENLKKYGQLLLEARKEQQAQDEQEVEDALFGKALKKK